LTIKFESPHFSINTTVFGSNQLLKIDWTLFHAKSISIWFSPLSLSYYLKIINNTIQREIIYLGMKEISSNSSITQLKFSIDKSSFNYFTNFQPIYIINGWFYFSNNFYKIKFVLDICISIWIYALFYLVCNSNCCFFKYWFSIRIIL